VKAFCQTVTASVASLLKLLAVWMFLASSPIAFADTPTVTWDSCAAQYGTCNVQGTRTVRLGVSPTSQYVDKVVTGSIACGASAFGSDPAPGQTKACWSSVTWSACAAQYANCSFSGTRAVRLGVTVTSQFVEKVVSNTISCQASAFGSDPAVGVPKSCWVTDVDQGPPPVAWTKCADQYNQCNVTTGAHAVRFGATATTQFIERTVTGSILCQASAFGVDPAVGSQKSCWSAAVQVQAGIPGPTALNSLPLSGPIVATQGQMITGWHVTSSSGPCIIVPAGVTGVSIVGNQIGPCGSTTQASVPANLGVQINPGATNVLVRSNVCHDVSSCVYADGAQGVVVDRNQVFNIRGPLPRGQMAQFIHFPAPAVYQTKVTCNRVDGLSPSASTVPNYWVDEDHVNLGDSFGSALLPIEIAYNQIRGTGNYLPGGAPTYMTGSESGSGFLIGDGGTGDYVSVHDNTLVKTNNVAISIISGQHVTVDHNRVKNDGANQASMTGWAISSSGTCTSRSITNNRGIARLWAYDHTGATATGYLSDNACTSLVMSGNVWSDQTLTDAIFDDGTYNAFCN
jgi:hypothetical protein